MNETKYKKLLSSQRIRKSSLSRTHEIDQFYSDRSRIIYSSSFRRLQQKAQVFSLETNSSVRTRMTHTLEVTDLGRTLASKISQKLVSKNLITDTKASHLVAIVENACLLHDIGNPPFGHFGEYAIKNWSSGLAESLEVEFKENATWKQLFSDFLEFDGNPQGFRIITHLHTDVDKNSLNLTYATLLSSLKYARCAGESADEGIRKKAGYFYTEKTLVEKIHSELGLTVGNRFPLAYIMEAVDDIAYCMSDIADGIEKRILTPNNFIEEFKKIWNCDYGAYKIPVELPDEITNFSHGISIPWSRKAIAQAVANYTENHEEFYTGKAKELIPKAEMGRVLKTVKKVSRRLLYNSIEAESIELTGFAVISGILKHYEKIIKMSPTDFSNLMRGENLQGFDFERRLYNRIGKRYIKAYEYAIAELDVTDHSYELKERWLRIHLIIDHISGMTDEFALETYQMLEGINLLKV